jgi:hypothetical protein
MKLSSISLTTKLHERSVHKAPENFITTKEAVVVMVNLQVLWDATAWFILPSVATLPK